MSIRHCISAVALAVVSGMATNAYQDPVNPAGESVRPTTAIHPPLTYGSKEWAASRKRACEELAKEYILTPTQNLSSLLKYSRTGSC